MSRKIIYISYDAGNDRYYRNLLVGWDKNKEFDFEFYDGSLTDSINSANADNIKSKIRPLIQRATHLLCIVGKESAKNEWIDWEIQTAASERDRLIGVKLDQSFVSPGALLNYGATWATSFTFDSIKVALDAA